MNPFSTHGTRSFRGVIWMAAAVVAAAGGLAVASLLPEGNPLHASAFVVSLAGKYLAYAMLALSVDLEGSKNRWLMRLARDFRLLAI